jgi:hypothetical protein
MKMQFKLNTLVELFNESLGAAEQLDKVYVLK